MALRNKKRVRLDRKGLVIGSPQMMGAIRIVPLIRPPTSSGASSSSESRHDLRIGMRTYDSYGVVAVDEAGPTEPGIKYIGFIPHGFVVSYTSDGSPVAALGASFGAANDEKKNRFVRLMHRMVKREQGEGTTSRFRMLPLHLAMEGYLALHFAGPDIVWPEYSKAAIRHGLDPRIERTMRGAWLPGFEEALRTFEIAPHQVGVLVFVAEALATAFVMPHPDDYRRVHRSLLEDFLGELLYHYAILHPDVPHAAAAAIDPSRVSSLEDLSREIARMRQEYGDYAELLASGLFDHEMDVESVRHMGPFELTRFVPKFELDSDCHIGERIVRDDGTLEYMKTFRLSAAQVRRGYLLEQLAAAQWHLADAAKRLNATDKELASRLVNAGLGHLLNPSVLAGLPKAARW
jgi:hypothetical protein